MDAAVERGVDVTAVYKPWLPVDLMQTLLVDVHEALGCSWFMAIAFACLGIRLVTLPVSVAAIRGGREKALIQPQFTELVEKQKQLTLEGNQEKLQEVQKQLQAFTTKHGKFFMFRGMSNMIFFQMPLYITAFAAMRGFAGHPDQFRGFAMESPLWLDSLALPDPYALLPMFTASIMLTNTVLFGSMDSEMAPPDMGQSLGPAGSEGFAKYQKYIMRAAPLAFVPLTWNFPAGIFVFMSTNMMASTLQNRLMRLPALERLLEIPPRPEVAEEAAKALASTGPMATVSLGKTLRYSIPHDFGGATAEPASTRAVVAQLAGESAMVKRKGDTHEQARVAAAQGAPRMSLRRVRPATHADMLS